MNLNEALKILKSNKYLIEKTSTEKYTDEDDLKNAGIIAESVFDGIYSSDTFEAIFNMSDESFTEFIKLCKQIRKEKKNYKPEYAYSIIANSKLGEKFVNMIKMNR